MDDSLSSNRPSFPILATILALELAILVVGVVVRPLSSYLVTETQFYPTVESVNFFASLAVAILCLGRYQVLLRPFTLWVGLAFGTSAIVDGFYLMSRPGLGGVFGLVERGPGLSAWLWCAKWSALALLLLAANATPIGTQGFSRALVAYLAGGLLAGAIGVALVAAQGPGLPALLTAAGRPTPLHTGWVLALLAGFAAVATLSIRRASRSHDRLGRYVGCAAMVAAFSMLYAALSWWPFAHTTALAVSVIPIVGLLEEYVEVLQRERQTSARLQAALDATQAALDQVERERQRLDAVIGSTPTGILLFDANGVLTRGNPAAETILGRPVPPPPEVGPGDYATYYHFRRSDGSLYRGDDLPSARALRDGTTVVAEEQIVQSANGWNVYISANAAPIRDGRDRIIGTVVALTDMTVRHEDERLREEFIASAAREFRSPLTVIKGYDEVLLRSPAPPAEMQRKALEAINHATERAAALANELLQSSRSVLRPFVVQREPIDLAALVESVVEHARAEPTPDSDGGHRHALAVKRRPVYVLADRGLLEEALRYVLRYAAGASPPRSEVAITLDTWDGEATVAITHHGPMVPPARLPHLFDPLARDAAGQENGRSGGRTAGSDRQADVGLYLARRILTQSGGWIHAESTPGATTIAFTLPWSAAQSSNGQSSNGQSSADRRSV